VKQGFRSFVYHFVYHSTAQIRPFTGAGPNRPGEHAALTIHEVIAPVGIFCLVVTARADAG
jgi:hypothetical protein